MVMNIILRASVILCIIVQLTGCELGIIAAETVSTGIKGPRPSGKTQNIWITSNPSGLVCKLKSKDKVWTVKTLEYVNGNYDTETKFLNIPISKEQLTVSCVYKGNNSETLIKPKTTYSAFKIGSGRVGFTYAYPTQIFFDAVNNEWQFS
jgi:hypothetical protein